MEMSFEATDNAAVFVMEGSITANGTQVDEHNLVLFENEGSDIELHTSEGAHVLVLNGTPLGEPIVANGPFVMNSRTEIMQAYADYDKGLFGHLV